MLLSVLFEGCLFYFKERKWNLYTNLEKFVYNCDISSSTSKQNCTQIVYNLAFFSLGVKTPKSTFFSYTKKTHE